MDLFASVAKENENAEEFIIRFIRTVQSLVQKKETKMIRLRFLLGISIPFARNLLNPPEGEIPGHLLTVSCSDVVFTEVVRVVFEKKQRIGRIAVYANIDKQLSQPGGHFKSGRILHRRVPPRFFRQHTACHGSHFKGSIYHSIDRPEMLEAGSSSHTDQEQLEAVPLLITHAHRIDVADHWRRSHARPPASRTLVEVKVMRPLLVAVLASRLVVHIQFEPRRQGGVFGLGWGLG